MSKTILQGQGDTTEWKQRGLGSAFFIGLKVAAEKLPASTYFHFDLNAGCGFNHEACCIGSPVAFFKSVEESGHKKVVAHFVDKDRSSLEQLQTLIPAGTLHHTHNKDFVSSIPSLVGHDRFAVGSILCDPNGADVPFDELAAVLKDYKRLDLIINWNSTIYKRCNASPLHSTYPQLQELPELFNKQYCHIRSPLPGDRHGFTLFVGRNFKTDGHRKLGFYSMDADQGEQIAHRLDTTAAQRKSMFFGAQLQLSI